MAKDKFFPQKGLPQQYKGLSRRTPLTDLYEAKRKNARIKKNIKKQKKMDKKWKGLKGRLGIEKPRSRALSAGKKIMKR